jgi:hypothetical protein
MKPKLEIWKIWSCCPQWRLSIKTEERLCLIYILHNLLFPSSSEQFNTPQRAASLYLWHDMLAFGEKYTMTGCFRRSSKKWSVLSHLFPQRLGPSNLSSVTYFIQFCHLLRFLDSFTFQKDVTRQLISVDNCWATVANSVSICLLQNITRAKATDYNGLARKLQHREEKINFNWIGMCKEQNILLEKAYTSTPARHF